MNILNMAFLSYLPQVVVSSFTEYKRLAVACLPMKWILRTWAITESFITITFTALFVTQHKSKYQVTRESFVHNYTLYRHPGLYFRLMQTFTIRRRECGRGAPCQLRAEVWPRRARSYFHVEREYAVTHAI